MDITREDKLAQLERVLQSHALHASESLRSFLRFVVSMTLDDQEDQLKEYTIATEVFGRRESYSSKTDSVVRVQASRLRAKLQEYYATEGKSDTIIIELPKGRYKPVFSLVENGNQASDSPNSVPAASDESKAFSRPLDSPLPRTRERAWLIGLSTAVVILLITTALLAFSNLEWQKGAQGSVATLDGELHGAAWALFLNSGDPTLIVLGNPPVYRFVNAMDPPAAIERSIVLSPEQSGALAEELGNTFIIKNNPTPKLLLCADEYTGIGEAIGLYRLTDLFRTAGKSVVLKQSRNVSAEDLKNHNVILLGSIWVNEWSGRLPERENFVYSGRATIENQDPQPGEEREYKPRFDPTTGKLIEDYALITVKPNLSQKTSVMVLAGIHSEGTQAAAEYVTSKGYLNALNQRLQHSDASAGTANYYQALLRVAVDNGIPTTLSLVSVRRLTSDSN